MKGFASFAKFGDLSNLRIAWAVIIKWVFGLCHNIAMLPAPITDPLPTKHFQDVGAA